MEDPDEAMTEEERREQLRKAIFQALVDAQDLQELTRTQAQQLIARRFGISEAEIRDIETEGMDRLWPPL